MTRKKMIEAAGIPQPLFTMDEISEHVRVYYVRCVPLTSEAVSIVKGLPGIGDASLVANNTLVVTKADSAAWSDAEVGVLDLIRAGASEDVWTPVSDLPAYQQVQIEEMVERALRVR